jgi:ABC-2 type transport system permease protein
VTDVLLLARNHLMTALRERVTLFWFLIFPVFLLVLLALVFGNMGQEGEISFEVSIANLDRESASLFPKMIEDVFDALAVPRAEGEEALLRIRKPSSPAEAAAFIEEEIVAVRRGRRAALLVIPEGLGEAIERQLIPVSDADASDVSDAALTIYHSEASAASGMAVTLIDQVLAGIDREILVRGGRFDPALAIPERTAWVGSTEGQTPYIDFLLPGIILMGLFTNGLFGVPGAILFSRDRRILRRYWVTPFTVPRFLAGMSIGHVALSLLQFGILYAIGRFALGASVSFATLPAALFLLLATATFMAFGFLIASVSKTANAGMAIANILNMPMMFLSGLFFPITGLPSFIKAIVYANPVSYLADGLRAALGIEAGLFPTTLVIAIPAAWIVLSTAVAARKLRWDVAR